MAANLFLAVGKMIAGVAGHSHALIADGIESLADLFSSVIVWRGIVVAAEPADEEHPYGHGKAEPIAAAFVAAMLLLAAAWIAIQSVHEIIRPHAAPEPFTLAVLVGVILIKEGLFRFVLKQGADLESSVVRTDAWHHRSDAITSLAAGIGIAVALLGGPGFEMADDVAALVAAGVIAWNGFSLLRPALSELMDSAPEAGFVERVRAVASKVRGVQDVEKCVVRKAGYHYFVDIHVEVDPLMTVQDAHGIAHDVKDEIRRELPQVADVLVHIEPCGRGAVEKIRP